jgi:hypothetical protein
VLGNVFQTTHWSIAANLVWSPVPKVDLGVEYIYYHINFASEGPGVSTAGHDHRIEAESIFHF